MSREPFIVKKSMVHIEGRCVVCEVHSKEVYGTYWGRCVVCAVHSNEINGTILRAVVPRAQTIVRKLLRSPLLIHLFRTYREQIRLLCVNFENLAWINIAFNQSQRSKTLDCDWSQEAFIELNKKKFNKLAAWGVVYYVSVMYYPWDSVGTNVAS